MVCTPEFGKFLFIDINEMITTIKRITIFEYRGRAKK